MLKDILFVFFLLLSGVPGIAESRAELVNGSLNALRTAEHQALSESLPATFRAPFGSPAEFRLPPVAQDEFDKLKSRNLNSGGRIRPLAVGFPRDFPAIIVSPARDGLKWHMTQDGGLALKLRVISPGAASLRVEWIFDQLPSGLELRFQGKNGHIIGPVRSQEILQQGSRYWSPLIEGESLLAEVYLPPQSVAAPFEARMNRLSHHLVNPSEPVLRGLSSSVCELDLVCNSDEGVRSIAKSVARMYFVENGVGMVCSGTLLNNTRQDRTPYFLTAAHCISDPVTAATLNTSWFYEKTTCGGQSVSSSNVTRTGGAQLLYTSLTVYDVSLLRLNNQPPSGVIYSGWSYQPLGIGTSALGIHHPGGDVKKFASGTVVDTTLSFILADTGALYRNFIETGWTQGLVEAGSSGSGLFTPDGNGGYWLRGALTSGTGDCSTPLARTGVYSALSLYFSSLQSYLAPTATNSAPQSGWWWNPSESGRGFAIEIRNGNLFMAGYLYANNGRATWFASGGAMSSSMTYSGDMKTYSSGQSLNGGYVSPVETASLGSINITFQDATHATLTWPGGTIPIERFNIVPGGAASTPTSAQPETGWWWNSAESGRGFALEIQSGTLFMAGYMYDEQGNPIWYSSGNAMTSSNSYSGNWVQYANGQTLTGAYRAPSVANSNVGPVNITFHSTTTGTMVLPNGRSIGIQRFRF